MLVNRPQHAFESAAAKASKRIDAKLCFGSFLARATSFRTVKRPCQPVYVTATAGPTDTRQSRKSYNRYGCPPKLALPQMNAPLVTIVRGHCGPSKLLRVGAVLLPYALLS